MPWQKQREERDGLGQGFQSANPIVGWNQNRHFLVNLGSDLRG
jgi:hypothetical protein